MRSPSRVWMAERSCFPHTPDILCWWSIRHRSAAIHRNMPGSRTCGCAIATRGCLCSGCHPMTSDGQEPGGATDIHATAQGEYHVTFPITEKVTVKGKDAHPFYRWAAAERPLEAPRWNFHKYLVGRDGYLKAGFTSAIEPAIRASSLLSRRSWRPNNPDRRRRRLARHRGVAVI